MQLTLRFDYRRPKQVTMETETSTQLLLGWMRVPSNLGRAHHNFGHLVVLGSKEKNVCPSGYLCS